MTAQAQGRPRRAVATRILYSYLIILSLFACASTWSVVTFRDAVADAALLRQGYLPLALSVRDLLSNQDTYNSQLNHVTSARNPADARIWFDSALAVGRPKQVARVEETLERALPRTDPRAKVAREELSADLGRVRKLMEPDGSLLAQLFGALEQDNAELAQKKRDELVLRGLRVRRALAGLESRVSSHIEALVSVARAREHTALQILVVLGIVTLLVGVLMALYARRVLGPLSKVTRRASAVAAGDLSVQAAIDSGDEIGELSQTFEGMVRAIADARERLLASERLAAIGKMAAHVTHEVRNPLSSIALNLELLEEELSPESQSEEARSLVRAIGQEVQRLSGLSDQYLSMARRKAPELEECDLGALIGASVQFMRRDVERHGIELRTAVPRDLPWLSVDQAQIRQTLFNLVRNAREAMPEGGVVTLRVVVAASEVVLQVEDTGPGVPVDQVERLFDPFFTTKDHGTGLGLAVTAQILAAHGGRLSYSEAIPHGSIFSAHLPLDTIIDQDETHDS